MKYHDDYPKTKIGGGNPYSCCFHCGKSVPEINGVLENHAEWCEYRKKNSTMFGLKSVDTYYAKIYIGLRKGYEGPEYDKELAIDYCQEYCDVVGLGVNVHDTKFIYTDGNEGGLIIELINYPRFPSDPDTVFLHAYTMAHRLREILRQHRCTIMCPDKTYLIGEE